MNIQSTRKKNRIMKIGILAATFSGNKGAAAMLSSIVDNLTQRYENVEFNVLSVYPDQDKKQCYFNNCEIVSAKPEEILFKAFPLAILFRLFRPIKFFSALILKNPTIKGFFDSDFIIDAAGISFVDSRGFVMNTYNFVCMAIPLLLGKKIIKFSQAIGPMNKIYNKFYAKLVLTKMEYICSRGSKTREFLEQRKLTNIVDCADGGFSLNVQEKYLTNIKPIINSNPFFEKEFICLSISSVVYKYCQKVNIDYVKIMVDFIKFVKKDTNVYLLANAAREDSENLKNNDLPVCREIMSSFNGDKNVLFIDREFTPYEIWFLTSKSKALVGSRFHAMVAALSGNVPVMLVGWSHKYKEVMDEFGIDDNCMDYNMLTYSLLIERYELFMKKLDDYAAKILMNKEKVFQSSAKNFEYIDKVIKRL